MFLKYCPVVLKSFLAMLPTVIESEPYVEYPNAFIDKMSYEPETLDALMDIYKETHWSSGSSSQIIDKHLGAILGDSPKKLRNQT